MPKNKSLGAAAAVSEPPFQIAIIYQPETLVHPGVDFPPDDPNSRSVTNQSDKDGTDINQIMARYEKTGLITVNGQTRPPMYGDFTIQGDYLAMQNTIVRVTEAFNAYPAQIRAKFNHDPGQLIEYLANPDNDKEAISLGLKQAPEEPETPPVTPSVTPPVTPPAATVQPAIPAA